MYNFRKLNSTEIAQVSGAETTLANREDGLHVYMTHKDEQFEFMNFIFRPDGRCEGKDNTYHYEIIESMSAGAGQFHARIWK